MRIHKLHRAVSEYIPADNGEEQPRAARFSLETPFDPSVAKVSPSLSLDIARRHMLAGLGLGCVGMAVGCSTRGRSGNPTATVAGLDLSQVDSTVRPQDDIYRYVNGKWLDSYKLPDDKPQVSAFGELHDQNIERLKSIIENISSDNEEKKKIARLYHSVLDTDALDNKGLANITGQWKLIDSAQDKEGLAHVVGLLNYEYGFSFPVDFGPEADSKNSNVYVFYIGNGGLGLSRRFLVENRYEKLRSQYLEFLTTIARHAHVVHPQQDAELTVSIEKRIAEGIWDEAKQRDPLATYNVSSIESFISSHQGFAWKQYLSGARIPEKFLHRLIVDMPSYYDHFVSIWSGHSLDDLKKWIKISALRQTTSFLPRVFRDASFHFYSGVINGVKQRPPRWKTAVGVTDEILGDALGKLYVQRHFPPEAKKEIHDLIDSLIAAYKQRLSQSWLSASTKKSAIHKLEAIGTSKVGYPDRWENYEELDIGNDYYENYRKYLKWSFHKALHRFPHPVDKTLWGMTPATVNAYYSPLNNEIVFPAGILQAPFFDKNADLAVNYGGIGAVIGHEISHAFDDQGAQYDAQGNLRSWWTHHDEQKFKQLTARLADQYGKFVPHGLDAKDHINGPISVGENAADLNGLTTAARAYRGRLNNGNIDGPIAPEKLQNLFLNWSRIYREKWRKEALVAYLPTAVHSPGEARARQTVKNIDDFVYAFGVKSGDKEFLPPGERIHIW